MMSNIKNEACNLLQTLPPELLIRSKKNFQFKSESKEVCKTFLTYFGEQFPELKNLKFGIVPGSMRTIARARYQNRTLYARAYTIHDCVLRFIEEYQMKVV